MKKLIKKILKRKVSCGICKETLKNKRGLKIHTTNKHVPVTLQDDVRVAQMVKGDDVWLYPEDKKKWELQMDLHQARVSKDKSRYNPWEVREEK